MHLMLKYPTSGGIGELRRDKKSARKCYLASVNEAAQADNPRQNKRARTLHQKVMTEDDMGATPNKEVEIMKFVLGQPDKTFRRGKKSAPEHREKLIKSICRYQNIFAWSPEDMSMVHPGVAIPIHGGDMSSSTFIVWITNVMLASKPNRE